MKINAISGSNKKKCLHLEPKDESTEEETNTSDESSDFDSESEADQDVKEDKESGSMPLLSGSEVKEDKSAERKSVEDKEEVKSPVQESKPGPKTRNPDLSRKVQKPVNIPVKRDPEIQVSRQFVPIPYIQISCLDVSLIIQAKGTML